MDAETASLSLAQDPRETGRNYIEPLVPLSRTPPLLYKGPELPSAPSLALEVRRTASLFPKMWVSSSLPGLVAKSCRNSLF